MSESHSFDVFLETACLVLRRFTPADAPLLHDLDSDPDVMRYITRGQATPISVIEQKILPKWIGYYEQYEHLGFWAAHEKASGDFVGWFHYRPDWLQPDDVELGYRLKRVAWGKGYATEGSRALIKKGFTVGHVNRVVARTLVGNLASRRVMEKAGLRFVQWYTYPEERLPGWTAEERAAVTYALRRTDYQDEEP